jgi:hypothetical protein
MLYRLTSFALFLVRFINHLKKISKWYHLLKILTSGSNKKIIGIVIRKFPSNEIETIVVILRSVKRKAHGIEPLSSPTGSIDKIKVINLGLSESFWRYCIIICSIYFSKLIL